MKSQISSISALLKSDNHDFIRSLVEISFISKDVYFEAIRECYYDESLAVIQIVSLIDDYFEFDDQDVLNCLFTKFIGSRDCVEKDIGLFKRMVDMGAKVREFEYSDITMLPPDLFFYYAERNDTDINLYIQSGIECHLIGHVQVYDWIFECWISADIEHNQLLFSDIAQVTYAGQGGRYFERAMAKLRVQNDFYIVLFRLLNSPNINSKDLIEYMSDCKYEEELLFFSSLILLTRNVRELDDRTASVQEFIKRDNEAKLIVEEVYRARYYNDGYRSMILGLEKLSKMMKIDS